MTEPPTLEPTLRLRALRVVEMTHRLGTAVAAAQALHVSASAVSRTIRQAEQILRVPLFERGTQGMVCTAPGQAVVQASEAIRRELLFFAPDAASLAEQRHAESLSRTLTLPMLRCFVACAELANETQAARALQLSQPAVSQHLRALQKALGQPLLQRTRHGLRLTTDGERALAPFARVLNILRVLDERVSTFRGGPASGRLHLGVLPMASTGLAPQALAVVLQRMPQLMVTVSDGTYEAMVQQLKTGDVDLLIGPLRGALAAPELEEHELFRESLIAVVRAGHALAAPRRRARPLRALWSQAWIAPLENTPAHAAYVRAFEAAGLPAPRPSVRAHSPTLVRALLQRSDHIALMSPMQIAEDLQCGALVRVNVGLKTVDRPIGIAVRRGFLWPPSCLLLLEQLQALSGAARA